MFKPNRDCSIEHFVMDNRDYIFKYTELEKITIKGDVVEVELWFHGNGIHYIMIFSETDNLKFKESIDWKRVIDILSLMIYFGVGEKGRPPSASIEISDELKRKEGTVTFKKTQKSTHDSLSNTNKTGELNGHRISLHDLSRDFWDYFWENQPTNTKITPIPTK